MEYGYVRVSAKDQKEGRQIVAMLEFGLLRRNIVVEKMSGKDFSRPKYQRLIKKLTPSDTLIIKSIDRLGRDYEEIIEQWRHITKDIGAAIVVLDMPLLDTRQRPQDLTGAFIADLVLQILSYIAEMERMFNRHRQAEGIALALAKGVRFGRKPKERPAAFATLRTRWESGEVSAREAARQLGISHPTFLAWTGK